MLLMSRGGCRRPRLPAALCTLLLLQYQQVPGTNAHPANEDYSNDLEMIEGIISMPNFKNNMMVLFPLDYKVETNVLPDIKAEDEICTTGLSFHLLNNDLKHLNSHLHEQHPVQKHINHILEEMSVLDILKKITKSYSKAKISPSELIYKLQSVLGYLKKYKADFKTFQDNLESCIFLHHVQKPTVAGDTHISLSTATHSDETLTANTSMYLDNEHATAAARGLDQSVTVGTSNRVRNMFTNSIASDEVNATTSSILNSTAASKATAQAISIITSGAVSHREMATPPTVETNSTDSYASDPTLLTPFVTRATASTNNERINLDSTAVSGYLIDSTQAGTGGATVAPSKVTSDGDLNLGTSPDKQANATGTPHFIGNFSAARPSEPSFSSSTKREQIQSSTWPSKNISSHPTESTSQTSRGTTTDHRQAKRSDAVPTLAKGSELLPSSDSYRRPAKRHNEGPPIDPLKPADQRHQCSTSAANRTVHTDTVLFFIMGIYAVFAECTTRNYNILKNRMSCV